MTTTTHRPVVLVAGYGRCGSTMLMRMLHAGGIPPTPTSDPASYETRGATDLADRRTYYPGHAVKILTGARDHDIVIDGPAVAIWLDRDPTEQARSALKMIAAVEGSAPTDRDVRRFVRGQRRDRHLYVNATSRLVGGRLLVTTFEAALDDPTSFAAGVGGFLTAHGFLRFDAVAAAAVVHRRDPACLPGLDVEAAYIRATAVTR